MPNLKPDIIEQIETFKDLCDNAHDLIYLVEPHGTIVYANAAWSRILGYTQRELLGKSILSIVYPADRDRFANYQQSITTGGERENEIVIRMLTKTDSVVDTEGFLFPKTTNGSLQYTQGIFRDISHRTQHEKQFNTVLEKLREREANHEQLLLHAPDAIVVADTKSIIRYWNPKAEHIFGWSANDVLGKALTEVIIPQKHRQAHIDGMKRYVSSGEAHVLNQTVEITALRKDGTEFYVALTISPTHQHGHPAFIAFVRDIDRQKTNENELHQKRLELEHNSVQLEASNQKLEQFAHVASHDMKEPVRKMAVFADRLKNDSASVFSEDARLHISKIQKAATRLTKMVDSLLAYSTLSAEDPKSERIELKEIVKNVETDLELQFLKHRATLKYTDLPAIHGFPLLINQLFYNLLNNSLKFSKVNVDPVLEITARKLPRLEVEHYGLDVDKRFIEVVVSDNGIGFDQGDAEIIFQSFTRLHSKDKYEGTGLGLSLCKTIVEKHKGIIRAHGKANAGAQFHIVLPDLS